MTKLSSGGRKMSLTEKPVNQDNAVVDGTQSEDHSLQISMENVRLRDDHDNRNRYQMDDVDISQNLKPEVRSNNGDVLPQNKLRQVLEPKVLVHHNRGAEAYHLLDGKKYCKMTEKGRQYRLAVLEKRRAKLVARTIRKSSEISHVFSSEQYHCERRDAAQNQVQNIAQNLVQNQVLHQNQGHPQRQKQLKRK